MHREGKGPLVIKCPFTGQSVNKVEHGGNHSVRTVQAKDPWNNNGNQVSLRSAVAAQGKARVWHGAPHRAPEGPFPEQGKPQGESKCHCVNIGIQKAVQGPP